jgi:hypothetical protein
MSYELQVRRLQNNGRGRGRMKMHHIFGEVIEGCTNLSEFIGQLGKDFAEL